MAPVLFDDSLDALLDVARQEVNEADLAKIVIHREAAGRLALFFDGTLPNDQRSRLERALTERLGAYARTDQIVADRSTLGAARVLAEPERQWVNIGNTALRYIDRRIVGADWLTKPATDLVTPPRFVFASLKGGVGRTTALCVAAAELSRQGKNVLVVDLDLEAPGVGSLLLKPESVPKFGATDYLVESVMNEPEALSFVLGNCSAASFLMSAATGRVDIVPAIGQATRPEQYLGKLARALVDIGPDGSHLSVSLKLQRFLDALVAQGAYDVVLIDSRAGLAELAAGPILCLGATVLLFGTAQLQTIEDFRLLFGHLASLVKPETGSPWKQFRTVLAKAGANEEQNRWFVSELHALFTEYFYEELDDLEGFNFEEDDKNGPHYPVLIGMNPVFANWDPGRRPEDLTQPFYESSFRPFLDDLKERLES